MAQARRPTAARTYQVLPLAAPTGGMDLRTALTQLGEDRARVLRDVSLSEPGVFLSRSGSRLLYSDTVIGISGATKAQGGIRCYFRTNTPNQASTQATILAYEGNVATLSTGGTPSVVLGGKYSSAVDAIHFIADREMVAAFDGQSTAQYKSTNGSTWTRFGLVPPSSATLSTLSTGGLSSGEYAFSITYKDRDLAYQSNGFTESTITLSASSGAVNVVVPNSTDPQIEAFVVYARKVSAGETVLRKVSSQAQSGGANSTMVVTSTAWTTGSEIPTTHTAPPALAFGCAWKNRWWARDGAVTNRLRFSELLLPQAWPADFYVDIPFEQGDDITAILPFGDTLLIFGRTKIFIVLGTTATDFEVRPALGSRDGAFGPRAVAALDNGVVHAGAVGVQWFDGTADALLSVDIEPAWQTMCAEQPSSRLSQIAVCEDRKRRELKIAAPVPRDVSKGDEWVLDLAQFRSRRHTAWAATSRKPTGYLPFSGPEQTTGEQHMLWTWQRDATGLFISKESTGTGPSAQWFSRALDVGPHHASWVDVRGEYEPQTSSGRISVGIWRGGEFSTTVGIPLSSAAASSVFGIRYQCYTPLPLGQPARTIAFLVGAAAPFRINRLEVGLVPEPEPRGFGR